MNNIENIGMVLINGAGFSGWIWDEVTAALQVKYVIAELPDRGEPQQSRAKLSLADYADEVMQAATSLNTEKIIVVAHSLGGVIGLELASKLGERLAGFVAVCASTPPSGKSFVSVLPFPQKIIMPVILKTAGTRPPVSAITSGLCNDVSAELTQKIIETFTPESVRVFTDKTSYAPFNVPSLYIRTTHDKEYGIGLQTKLASNLPQVEIKDIATGHLPMLVKPQELAGLLNTFAATRV